MDNEKTAQKKTTQEELNNIKKHWSNYEKRYKRETINESRI